MNPRRGGIAKAIPARDEVSEGETKVRRSASVLSEQVGAGRVGIPRRGVRQRANPMEGAGKANHPLRHGSMAPANGSLFAACDLEVQPTPREAARLRPGELPR